MTFADIFDTKVVDDEAEEDGTPFLTQYARGGGTLVVAIFGETFSKEVVG